MSAHVNIEVGPVKFVDFSDAAAKAAFVRQVQALSGQYRVSITKRQRRRSLQQNAYLWGVVYGTIAQGIYEAWGESISVDEVHIFCKQRFLSKPICNRTTGEEMGRTFPSSARLTTEQFSEYLDKLNQFSADMLGVLIPSAAETF